MSTKVENISVDNKSLLDTLAQLGTPPKKSGKNNLKRRAVAKYLTNEIIYGLVDQDSSLRKSYWNSYHCSNILLQDGQKITGKYCNNRWCIVCNRIRTAKMIKGYLPTIKQEIEDPYFVTLTIPNVSGDLLKSSIRTMIKNFVRINSLFRHKRGYRIRGIRKIECTYNAERNDFHPHFHLLIDGDKTSQELVNTWLSCYPDADRYAQDVRQADDNSIIELFKYTTKLTTKSDIKREGDNVEIISRPESLDIIFKALYKIRTFQPMGITKQPVNEDIEEIQSEIYEDVKSDIEVWQYLQDVSDWISGSGECLTGCEAYKHYKVLRV